MSRLPTIADERFEQYFGHRLQQVFLYVTDECNLRCAQCYYRPWLKPGDSDNTEMEGDVLVALLEKFREMGAVKLSLLGGEPTLYGRRSTNRPIPSVIDQAKRLGYQYVRIVTNGLFDPSFLEDRDTRQLDEITFSVDGDTPEMHDSLRGEGTYKSAIANLRRAIELGYRVHITTCVHRHNVGKGSDGVYLLSRAINWAAELGVHLINFHPLLKMGIARDEWTGETDILPVGWTEVYNAIREEISQGKYAIPVRLPQRFVTSEEFGVKSSYYGYCPLKRASRVEVHPNGQIHSCALNNGTRVSLATFSRESDYVDIRWSERDNEMAAYPFDLLRDHPCAVMRKDFGDLVPLCISFKPNQEEFIWKTTGLS